jgi:hypothetical protein
VTDKDLLGKADGLMRRGAVGTDTGAVPVLTDFIEPPPVPPIESVAAPAAESAAAPGSPEAEIAAKVMERLDRTLELEMQRVRREMARAVAEAVREALGKR